MDSSYWPAITPRQQRLLFQLVEWERAAEPGDDEVMLVELSGGTYIVGKNAPAIAFSDIEQLAGKGYLHIRQPGNAPMVSVTAEGHAYYEAHQAERQPAEQLASRVRDYVDTTAVVIYPEVAARLQEAAAELWSLRRDEDVTTVGLKCRQALQGFAEAYYTRFYPNATAEAVAKEKTLDQISKVIRHLQAVRGVTDTSFADALFEFWRRLVALDQKVVHESRVAERPLTWEDGRKIVLYSYLVVGELHMLATGERTG